MIFTKFDSMEARAYKELKKERPEKSLKALKQAAPTYALNKLKDDLSQVYDGMFPEYLCIKGKHLLSCHYPDLLIQLHCRYAQGGWAAEKDRGSDSKDLGYNQSG